MCENCLVISGGAPGVNLLLVGMTPFCVTSTLLRACLANFYPKSHPSSETYCHGEWDLWPNETNDRWSLVSGTLGTRCFFDRSVLVSLLTSKILLHLRCCSMSSSLRTWSWRLRPWACVLRSCSAWRATGRLPRPGRTPLPSWSHAKCPASCDSTKARSWKPSRARPSDSTPWAAPQPRLTFSASSKSTEGVPLNSLARIVLHGWDVFQSSHHTAAPCQRC